MLNKERRRCAAISARERR